MLELSAAPTPTRTAAAASSTSPADPQRADSATSGSQDEQVAATPFAAVLQHQIKRPADSASPRHAVRQTEVVIADPTEDALPADALSMLAPMLAGINAPVPPVAAPVNAAGAAATIAATDADDKIGSEGSSGQAAIPIALPTANAALPVASGSAATNTKPAPERPAAAPSPLSAILAAIPAASAETAAETGNTGTPGESFESLLGVSRDTQMLAGHNTLASHTAAPPPASTTTVATPVGTRGWDNEVGEKLTWMVGRNETRADLVLNPPQLGRIEVSLSMNGDQTNAVFVSANPAVREALENAVPRLREILQDAGISLGQTQVGAESFQQSANNPENGDNFSRGGRNVNAGSTMTSGLGAGGSAPSPWLRRGSGLVDTFA